MKDERQKLETCYHCSTIGLMYIMGEAISNWNDYDENNVIIYWRKKKWFMLQCPACQNVSLYTEYESFDTPLDTEYVYPQDTFEAFFAKNRSYAHFVPADIRCSFESLLKVRHIDSQLCLVLMRKTIEIICKDQGGVGHSLEELLKSIINKNKWPEIYCDFCLVIKH